MKRILIIEDDELIAELERDYLEAGGFEVEMELDGREGLKKALTGEYDAMILDLMLPGMNGEEVLGKMKKEYPEIAVIISSARDDIQTRIAMLRAGADDYMIKPFDTEELLARLEAVLRRSGKNPKGEREPEEASGGRVLRYKDILMEPEDFRITVSGRDIRLTRREYLILELLMENPGKVFTKSNIYESVWNEEFLGEDNAVNVHISNIRQKLAKVHGEETYIETVWGIGFKMK